MTTRRTFIKIFSGAALGTLVPLKGFSLSAERNKDKWGVNYYHNELLEKPAYKSQC